jgi:hypothetical protein
MNNRTLEIRKHLMSKRYALGSHVRHRIQEQNIFDVAEIIAHIGANGQVESGFNQRGCCWTFDADFEGQPYRLVVGPHQYNPDLVYIVSLFIVHPGIKKGQNFGKYEGRTLTYSCEFTFFT